ncbi:MAG: hypothetical protein CMF96_07790 [Candidatus Marinimicrobia bacterium]|nr:hypothetical protein [Candidatus Neomarinimicrobiota bacterium]|tara:strand:- start:1577 stop:1849 length:273 start_codon:yes stop_codon:yes gene_type:complete
MKLYLIHAGFYDEKISNGIYESHANYFLAAKDLSEAKTKAKKIKEFKEKKMHIDGIIEVTNVDGYDIILEAKGNRNGLKQFSHSEIKILK